MIHRGYITCHFSAPSSSRAGIACRNTSPSVCDCARNDSIELHDCSLHLATPAMTAGTPPRSAIFVSAASSPAFGQQSSRDQELLISAIHGQHKHQTPSLADQPGYRDWRQAAQDPYFDDRQSSAGTPPEPAVCGRKRKVLHYLRTQEGYGGHFMDLRVQDPRGIFCLHSVPCCSGPFDDAGQCTASRWGGCCSCKLPMPLGRQE